MADQDPTKTTPAPSGEGTPQGTPAPDGDKNADGTPKSSAGPTPGVDADQIKAMVNEGVASAIQSIMKEPDAPQAAPQPAGPPVATDNPLRDAIQPFIEPELRKINLSAESAKDAALFYATNQEALEHRKEIETAFDSLVASGTPFTREAVWEWYKGKNFEKFHQKRNEEDKKKLDDATEAQTIDSGGRPVVTSAKVDIDTPDDQLDKALEGQTF